ncbi:MAG TPA: prepilin-type N-terminal cleavage/methylation domain-containing protein [Terriglobales bacterium]|nr:prepilin-type N-terminal cleavage/methylation domain-containing protein [Terriglobales bacterium]
MLGRTMLRAQAENPEGFSLIELLIVVAIILIIAAIAIPSLLRSRIAANESSAVESLRTIGSAQVTFQSTYPTVGYAATLAALGPGAGNTACPSSGPTSTAACLIDTVLANATVAASAKSGYYFTNPVTTATGSVNVTYEMDAMPALVGQTGVRGFCTDSDGVIHFDMPAAVQGSVSSCAGQNPLQ